MHILSRIDVNSAKLWTVRVSRSLQRLQSPMLKCKQMSTRILLFFDKSSKKHILFWNDWKIQYKTEKYIPVVVRRRIFCLQVHPMKHDWFKSQAPPQSRSTRSRAHGRLVASFPKYRKNQKWGHIDKARGTPLQDLRQSLEEFTDTCGRRRFFLNRSTRKHLSWTASSGTFGKSGIGPAQHFYSLPESDAVHRAEKFGDLKTADHPVSGEDWESRNNRQCAVVVRDLATHWIQFDLCKKAASQEPERSLRQLLEADSQAESQLDWIILWSLAKSVKCYPGIVVHPRLTFPKIEFLGEKVVGGFHGMSRIYQKRSKRLVGRENTKSTAIWENHSVLPKILLRSMMEHHPNSVRDQTRPHQSDTKVLPGTFFGYALCAGSIWTLDIMVAWKFGRAGNPRSEILNMKDAEKWRNFQIPDRRWNSQAAWKISSFPRSISIKVRFARDEEHGDAHQWELNESQP